MYQSLSSVVSSPHWSGNNCWNGYHTLQQKKKKKKLKNKLKKKKACEYRYACFACREEYSIKHKKNWVTLVKRQQKHEKQVHRQTLPLAMNLFSLRTSFRCFKQLSHSNLKTRQNTKTLEQNASMTLQHERPATSKPINKASCTASLSWHFAKYKSDHFAGIKLTPVARLHPSGVHRSGGIFVHSSCTNTKAQDRACCFSSPWISL